MFIVISRKELDIFRQELQSLPIKGVLKRFHPKIQVSPSSLLQMELDALGIMSPRPSAINAIICILHAPVWEIDLAGEFDRPGQPYWNAHNIADVDSHQPVTYRYPSYTRWQGKGLLQLNYLIWFSERPLTSIFDILGGALDGVIWRVTLNQDGTPLIYDTIHPCGCYHYFFPSSALELRADALQLPEPPFVPQDAPTFDPAQRIVIRLASTTHFVQRVYVDKVKTGAFYNWRDYKDLYVTPTSHNDHRSLSLFERNGLVASSERLERIILWPMGIPSAGAMRERGRHATAFVGERHFDDADLLQQLFKPVP